MSQFVHRNLHTKTALLDLPNELLSHIIEDLPQEDVYRVRQACKLLESIASRRFNKSFFTRTYDFNKHSIAALKLVSEDKKLAKEVRKITFAGIAGKTRRCKLCLRHFEQAHETCTNRFASHAWCEKELDSAQHIMQALFRLPKLEAISIQPDLTRTKPGYKVHAMPTEQLCLEQAHAARPNSSTRLFTSILRRIAAGQLKVRTLRADDIQPDHHSAASRSFHGEPGLLPTITTLLLMVVGFDSGDNRPPQRSGGHQGLSRLLSRLPQLRALCLSVRDFGPVTSPLGTVALKGERPFKDLHSSYEFKVMDHVSRNVDFRHLNSIYLAGMAVSVELLSRLFRTLRTSLRSLGLLDLKIIGAIPGQPDTVDGLIHLLTVVSERFTSLNTLALHELRIIDWDMVVTFQQACATSDRLLPLRARGTIQRCFVDKNSGPAGASHRLDRSDRDSVVRALTDLCAES